MLGLRLFRFAFVLALLAGCVTPNAAVQPATVTPPVTADAVAVVHALAVSNATATANATIAAPSIAVVPTLFPIGHDAGEPTLGITKDGTLFYAAITFKNDIGGAAPLPLPVTDILRSADGGTTWKDVTPKLPGGVVKTHFDTGDPYVYVDPGTGRVFDIDQRLATTCHTVTFSDDKGASWGPTDSPTCIGPTAADHQTIVAAKPHGAPVQGYANVVFVCWNSGTGTSCTRSLDGGRVFTPTVPPFLASEGGPGCGLVGHLKAGLDGAVYAPQECKGVVRVARTIDDGMSWSVANVGKYTVPASGDPEYDPSLAVDHDGNVHVVWEDPDGKLLLSTSADKGVKWSEPLDILPPTLTVGHLPAIAAGDAGRLVVAYMGSDTKDGYKTSKDDAPKEVWHGYLAIITDALGAAPVATTVRVDPLADPLVHGACGPSFRCPGATDFLDVVIDADGRPWASFVDACSAKCAAEAGGKNDQALGLVGTLAEGPSLFAHATALPPIHAAGK